MRKRHALPVIAAALLAAWLLLPQHQKGPPPNETLVATQATSGESHRAVHEVTGSGTVIRVLPDDTHGERHQRFILRLASGDTVLIAHNVDVAARVEPLRIGDVIEYHGEYVWNPQGGVVHWTHREPSGTHEPGWLRREGKTFQ